MTGDIKKFYTSSQVCKIINITYRQLDYYDRTDFVKPSVKNAGGYGTRRMYDFDDLMKLRVIKKLMDAGISIQRIRKAKRFLEENNGKYGTFSDVTLISDGETVYACNSDKDIIDTLKSGQGVFGIALGKVYEDLKGDITRHFNASPVLNNEKTVNYNFKKGGEGIN
jgi:DNA-binding transcriptional MerR regulator